MIHPLYKKNQWSKHFSCKKYSIILYMKIYNQNKPSTQKRVKTKKQFTRKNYMSGEGMLTSVWGPSLWHVLHTISFNYPINPTKEDKNNYRSFIQSLQYVLPCLYCRKNFIHNLRQLPLRCKVFDSRESFSKYIYALHEHINTMLGKKSNLTYNNVRNRYEHFRSRCNMKTNITKKKKEKGCIDPLHGKKSKCILHIVSNKSRKKTFKMDRNVKLT